MMIRCLIVDDEPPAREEWRYLLAAHGDVEVAGEAFSASTAVEALERLRPDLVILDIEMPGGDGFQVAARAARMEPRPVVVFATAFDRYAVRAFEESAVDYLLKPVEEARLARTLERVRAILGNREPRPDAGDIDRLLRRMGTREDVVRIPVERGGRIHLLAPEDIVFFRADGKVVCAHTATGAYLCHGAGNLGRVEEKLRDRGFCQISRAEVVNLARVRECSPWFNGRYLLVMEDAAGTELTVSRSRVGEFKKRLDL